MHHHKNRNKSTVGLRSSIRLLCRPEAIDMQLRSRGLTVNNALTLPKIEFDFNIIMINLYSYKILFQYINILRRKWTENANNYFFLRPRGIPLSKIILNIELDIYIMVNSFTKFHLICANSESVGWLPDRPPTDWQRYLDRRTAAKQYAIPSSK